MKVCLKCNEHFEDKQEYCPEDSIRLIDAGDDELIGHTIGGRYRIICAVGRGSMGIVYKAVQESSGREMAVKVLRNFHDTSEDIVKRFRREAKTASTLKHPNIVTLIDFGLMEDGQPYIVTEFLKGLTLAQFLRDHGAITPMKSRPIIKQVCEAIAEAHRHKIIHRDLKPENIVLQGKDQGGRFVKVVDFGVAKLLEDTAGSTGQLTMDGKVCGSPAYMSPEQCRGAEIDYRADIYALGVLMFETLTGKRPFQADDLMALMFMQVNEPAPRLSNVMVDPNFTSDLEAVIARALNKNPDERQQSADELWEDFNTAVVGKKKKNTQGGAAGWIAFSGWGGSTGVSLAEQSRAETEHFGVASGDQSDKIEQRQRLRRMSNQSLWFKVAAVALMLIPLFMFLRAYQLRKDLQTADVLLTAGRPEDAVKLLEKHKQDGDLAVDNAEQLNSAYLQTGLKLSKKKKFTEAVEILQRIPNSSRYGPEAGTLLKKFKHKTT